MPFHPSTRPAGSQPLVLTCSPGKQLLCTDGVRSTGIKITTADRLSRGLQSDVHGSAFTVGGTPELWCTPSPYGLLSPLCLQGQPLGTRPPPASACSSRAPRGSRGPETRPPACRVSAGLPRPPQATLRSRLAGQVPAPQRPPASCRRRRNVVCFWSGNMLRRG